MHPQFSRVPAHSLRCTSGHGYAIGSPDPIGFQLFPPSADPVPPGEAHRSHEAPALAPADGCGTICVLTAPGEESRWASTTFADSCHSPTTKVISWQQFDQVLSAPAQEFKGRTCSGLFGVPRGGLCLAVALNHAIEPPLLSCSTIVRPLGGQQLS